MPQDPGPESLHDRFRRALELGSEALNRGDWETAFAGLPPDFEFHPDPSVPDRRVLRDRAALVGYFQATRDAFPDWRSDPLEFIETGADRIIVRSLLGGTGSRSGLDAKVEVYVVWELENEIPVRAYEFFDRQTAFERAGLEV